MTIEDNLIENIKKITKEELDKFWAAYREYVFIASSTQDMKSEIVPDFLGYVERIYKEATYDKKICD